MIREPTDIPSVEQRDKNEFFCSMCTVTFDREAFDEVGGECPGCKDMADAQARRNQRGYRGAL